ncbi:MAG: AI-2E family transporter [Lachnospiraceae bacterium]|nr:AI-2E family transporter [Lachnospiraceae bacterium]
MSDRWNKGYFKLGIVLTVSLCICTIFGEFIKNWRGIADTISVFVSAMTPFIIGLVIAFLINPIMVYYRRGFSFVFGKKLKTWDYDTAFRKSKTPCLILTMLTFIGLLVGFLWIVAPRVYESLQDLVVNAPSYIESMRKWVEKMFAKNDFLEGQLNNILVYVEDNVMGFVENKIMPNIDEILITVSGGLVTGVTAIFNFLVGLIMAIYLLASKDVLLAQGKKIVYCIFSKKNGNKILEGLSYANSVFGGFINGKIIDSVIIGFMCYAFTGPIGMKYAVLISVIVGVTNIIPFFGPFIGAIPGCLLALMDSPMNFLIFLIFVIVLQQFDGNILGPLILGDSTGLSGMWVLVAILIGGDLFGVPGMILGVPVFACLYALFAVTLRDKLREKGLSAKTEDYFRLKGFDEETGEPIYRKKHEYAKRTIKKRKKLFRRAAREMLVVEQLEEMIEDEENNDAEKTSDTAFDKTDKN